MKMMIGLLFAGFLLLGSSFYFGIKYFDGKVVERPYVEAAKYDEKNQIIEDHNLSLEVLHITKTDERYKLCFTINGNNIPSPFPITKVEISRPAGGEVITPEIQIKKKICTLDLKLGKGFYIIEVFLKMEDEISLKKDFYIN